MKFPTINFSDASCSSVYTITKRCIDVSLGISFMLLSAPLWPLIAAAIKLDDGGPVFYRQERIGKGGAVFAVLKFRSLSVETGSKGLVFHRHTSDVTQVGSLLRKTALDELPQLLNILRGEMSFVGPRALVPTGVSIHDENRHIDLSEVPGFKVRTSIRPGLTGIAQVYARRNIAYKNKFRYDKIYVAKRSVALDLKLICLSIIRSVSGSWG